MSERKLADWKFNKNSGVFDIDEDIIPIDDAIPYPRLFNTFSILKVGQSFFIPNVSISSINYPATSASQYAARHNPNFRVTVLPDIMFEEDKNGDEVAVCGQRVWRLQDREA